MIAKLSGSGTLNKRTSALSVLLLVGWLILGACGEENTAPAKKEVELPKDRVLLLSNRDGWPDLYTVDTSGKFTGRLTETAAAEYSASWSPDGRKIAFVELNGDQAAGDYARNRRVVVIDADGSNRRIVASDGFNPVWAPDSQRLLFTRVNPIAAGNTTSPTRQVSNIMAAPPEQQVRPTPTPPVQTPGATPRRTADNLGGGSFVTNQTPGPFVTSQTPGPLNRVTPVIPNPVGGPPGPGLPGAPEEEATPVPASGGTGNTQVMQAGLYVTGLDGSQPNLLVAEAISGVWSPDSKRVAYIGGNNVLDQKRTLNILNLDGSGRSSISERAKLVDLDVLYVAWAPDGSSLAFTATELPKNKTSLYRVNPDNGAARKLADYDGTAREIMSLIWAYADYYNPAPRLRLGPAWSPNSRWLAFSDGSPRLNVVDAATGSTRYFPVGTANLGQDKDAVLNVGWLSDNRRLFYDRTSVGRNTLQAQAGSFIYDFFDEVLETLDTVNKNSLVLTNTPGGTFGPSCCGMDLLGTGSVEEGTKTPVKLTPTVSNAPSISSQNKEGKLVYVSGIGQRQLIVNDLKTDSRTVLASGIFKLIDFNLAPKGNLLTYVEVGERFNAGLYVASLDGKQKFKVSEGGGNPDDLSYVTSWSADGRQLAFQALNDDPKLKNGLYAISLDQAGNIIDSPRLITNKNVSAFTWSPDGKQIAYKLDADTYELYLAPADGKTSGQRIAAVGRTDTRYSSLGKGLAWSPDGRYLAMSGVGGFSYSSMWQVWLISPQGKIEEQAGYYINRIIGFTPDSSRLIATMATSSQVSSVQALVISGTTPGARGWRSYDRGSGPITSADSASLVYFNRTFDNRPTAGDNFNRLIVVGFTNGFSRSIPLEYNPYFAFKSRFFAWEPNNRAVAYYQNNTIFVTNTQGPQQRAEPLSRAFAVDRLGWTR